MSAMIEARNAMSHASYTSLELFCATNALGLTKPIEMVANAKGSPMMLARLNLLRFDVFMLYVLNGFFKEGEYNDL